MASPIGQLSNRTIGHSMECPHCGTEINAAAMLRAIKSEKRAEASRENGKKGGRPPSPNPVRPRKKR
jgi:hypothetical protein